MKKTSHVPSFLVEVSFGTVLDTFLAIHKKINEKYLPWHWCAEFSVSLWKQAPRMTRDTLLAILQWGWVDIELEMPSGIKVPLSWARGSRTSGVYGELEVPKALRC